MPPTALVIGGTGPTGPHVLRGLLDRGFDVTIFHRGAHEPPDLPEVRHVHGDPHFSESIDEAVGHGEYDVVVAAYGRTKLLARSFEGRAGHFVSIGGAPRYRGFYDSGDDRPSGMELPGREDSTTVSPGSIADADLTPGVRFGAQMAEVEATVFECHPTATHLIYPVVYGPRNVVPWEWSVIKRVLDGRPVIPIPDDGQAIHSRGAAANLAHALLLAVDQPAAAAGRVYNCADDIQYSLRQWVEVITLAMEVDVAIVGVPSAFAPILKAIYIPMARSICAHSLLDTSRVRHELGYRDVVTPAAALGESVAWYREHPVDLAATAPTFVDRFDYDLEDRLLERWWSFVNESRDVIPQFLPDDVHPMPHPKRPNQLADERSR